MDAAIYRHFSKSGELLYIGYSANPMRRNQQHSSYASWFKEVHQITIEWFDTHEDALNAEMIAIKIERPRENIVGMSDDDFIKSAKKRSAWRRTRVFKPHPQLDALQEKFKLGPYQWICRSQAADIRAINEIRESGRLLTTREVDVLKSMLKTSYVCLKNIGIPRSHKDAGK